MEITKPLSEYIEDYLNFIRATELYYRVALASEAEANDLSQDLLHDLELKEHTTAELTKFAKKIKQARKERRAAKDKSFTAMPIVQWAEDNASTIKGMEQLLGAVRKAEKNVEGRIYTPRTNYLDDEGCDE